MKTRIALAALFVLMVVMCLKPVASQDGDQVDLEKFIDRTIREYGVVESAKSVPIKCEIEGGSTILWLVPEGTVAKKGDLLARLDESILATTRSEFLVKANRVQSEVKQAQAKFQTVKKAAEQFQRLHELKLKSAQLNYKKHVNQGGAFVSSLQNARHEAELAEARLKLISRKIERTEKPESKVVVEDAEMLKFEAKKSRVEAANARNRISFLTELEHPYQAAILELAVTQANNDLLQHQQQAEAAIRKAEADLTTAELSLREVETQQKQIERQFAKCEIRSPSDGVVIYANSSARRAATSTISTMIEEGAAVREHQAILLVTDPSQFQVRTLVHESRIFRIREAQSAKLRFDAQPEQTFSGKVLAVSLRPEPTSFFNSDVKNYAVLVSIDAPKDKLKLGLSALVEIDAP